MAYDPEHIPDCNVQAKVGHQFLFNETIPKAVNGRGYLRVTKKSLWWQHEQFPSVWTSEEQTHNVQGKQLPMDSKQHYVEPPPDSKQHYVEPPVRTLQPPQQVEVDLLYLCDSEAALSKVLRWLGSGLQTTLAGDHCVCVCHFYHLMQTQTS